MNVVTSGVVDGQLASLEGSSRWSCLFGYYVRPCATLGLKWDCVCGTLTVATAKPKRTALLVPETS